MKLNDIPTEAAKQALRNANMIISKSTDATKLKNAVAITQLKLYLERTVTACISRDTTAKRKADKQHSALKNDAK